MVRQAEIQFAFARERFFARGVERRVFPRFAQGAVRPGYAAASAIGKPALLAATRLRRSQGNLCRRARGPENDKQSQLGGTGSRRAWPALRHGRRNAGGLAGGPCRQRWGAGNDKQTQFAVFWG